MIVAGKAFAAERREELLKQRSAFDALSLGVVMGEHDPVTSSFVRVKERNAEMLGVTLVRYLIPEGASTEAVQKLLEDAAKEDGIIVQLPLPDGVDTEAVLASIPPEKDVDALSPEMNDRLSVGDVSIVPPVAAAVREILAAHNISVSGKEIAIVGKGKLVGVPCAALFKTLGGKVTMLDKKDNLESLKTADIVMLGAGSPHLVKRDMVQDGVVILDAGTSEQAGVVVGDADPTVAEKASFFTPVPGGVGPMTIACLLRNTVTAFCRQNGYPEPDM